MHRPLILVLSVIIAGILDSSASTAVQSVSAKEVRYRNCAALNARYPHGVGRVGARDSTSSGPPVTNFKRNTALYVENKGRDRDKDGIACEKA